MFSDESKTILEISKSFEVALFLNPFGNLVGTTSDNTVNGSITFTSLRITTINNYALVASGYGLITENSFLFEINSIPFGWAVTVNSINDIIITFENILSNDLTSNDFLLTIDTSLNILMNFNGGDRQTYTYSTFPTLNIPDKTYFTLEVAIKNLISITGASFNNAILSSALNPYSIDCDASEYYEVFDRKCYACHFNCVECSGPYYYNCIICDKILFDGVCLSECPIGYIRKYSRCYPKNTELKIINFNFEGSGNIFYDTISHIQASSISNPISHDLPYSVYFRGIYFPENSALEVEFTNKPLLGNTFSFSLWIKPKMSNGTLITKYSDSGTLLTITLENFHPVISLEIDGILYKILSNSIVSLNWNHIFISLNPSLGLINIVNTIEETPKYLNDGPFVDEFNSTMLIGSDLMFLNSYKGFIFSIEVYNSIPSISDIVSTQCSECGFCPVSGICNSNCDIGEFYDTSYNKCSKCSEECSYVCKSYDNCKLCDDEFCISCKSYKTKSCLECDPLFEIIGGLCYPCSAGFYYSYIDLHCEECFGLCETCISKDFCLSCKENSSLNSLNKCICNLGYSNKNGCERNFFTAVLMIDEQNVATLVFSEELEKPLNSSQIEVKINRKEAKFELSSDLDLKYYITPELQNDIKNPSYINIKIVSDLVSVNNSLLKDKIFTGSLFITDELLNELKMKAKADAAGAYAKTGAISGLSIAIGISILKFDPTTLFDFLNTAEMFYAIYLMNFQINEVLSSFLLGLRTQDLLPNAFVYIVNEQNGVQMSAKFENLESKSNLFLINAGGILTSLIIMLVTMIIAYFMSKKNCMKAKLIRFLKSFKYNDFLRFWIQAYFELLILCTFGLVHSEFANPIQITDSFICIIFIVNPIQIIHIFMIFLMTFLIIKRRNLTDDDVITEFEDKFGTFFEEFKTTGISMWMFYAIYILRRTCIVLSYIFVKDGILQLSVCLAFSLIVFSI